MAGGTGAFYRNKDFDVYVNPSYMSKSGNIIVNNTQSLDVELEKIGDVVIRFRAQTGYPPFDVYINNEKKLTLIPPFEDTIIRCNLNDTFAICPDEEYSLNDGMIYNYYYNTGIGSNDINNGLYGSHYDNWTEHSIILTNLIYDFYMIESFTCCVPYYLQILYPNNITKSAEDVKVGDMIMGYNESNNTYQEVEVLNIIHKNRPDLCKVIFEDDTYLEITPDHPILTNIGWCAYKPETSKSYKEVCEVNQLTEEQKVLQLNGEYKQIKEIQMNMLKEPIDVYTFNTTEGVDTYIAEKCVVHNAGNPC